MSRQVVLTAIPFDGYETFLAMVRDLLLSNASGEIDADAILMREYSEDKTSPDQQRIIVAVNPNALSTLSTTELNKATDIVIVNDWMLNDSQTAGSIARLVGAGYPIYAIDTSTGNDYSIREVTHTEEKLTLTNNLLSLRLVQLLEAREEEPTSTLETATMSV